jgi:hypothetical protein
VAGDPYLEAAAIRLLDDLLDGGRAGVAGDVQRDERRFPTTCDSEVSP